MHIVNLKFLYKIGVGGGNSVSIILVKKLWCFEVKTFIEKLIKFMSVN